MQSEHQIGLSSPRLLLVSAVLAIGLILAYALPAVTSSSDDDYYSDSSDSLSFGDLGKVMDFYYGDGWIFDLSRAGVIVAIAVAAFGFPQDKRRLQLAVITVGSLLGLILPIYVFSKMERNDALGIGLWGFGAACVLGAILSWILEGPDSGATEVGFVAPPPWLSGASDSASLTTSQRANSVRTGSPGAKDIGVRLERSVAAPGETVPAELSGFAAGTPVALELLGTNGSAQTYSAGSCHISAAATVTNGHLTVPATAEPGEYTLQATQFIGSELQRSAITNLTICE